MIYPYSSKILQRHRVDDERGLHYNWRQYTDILSVMQLVREAAPDQFVADPAQALQDSFSLALHQATAVGVSDGDLAAVGPHSWHGEPVWLEFERPQSFGTNAEFEGALLFRLPLKKGHFVLPVLMGKTIEWPLPFGLSGDLAELMGTLKAGTAPSDQALYQVLCALSHVPPLAKPVPQHEANPTLLARLERHLKRVRAYAPNTAQLLPQFYLKRRKAWPASTFVPGEEVAHLLVAKDGMPPEDAVLAATEVALLTAWRFAKHVVRIDEDVLSALQRGKGLSFIPREFPALKAHAIYVPVPGGLSYPEQTGFFVGIDHIQGKDYLALLIEQRAGGETILAPVLLPLGEGVEESLRAMTRSGTVNFSEDDVTRVTQELGFALLCVAYLGSTRTQLLGMGQPKAVQIRRGKGGKEELGEVGHVPIWEAGVDTGNKLRAYKASKVAAQTRANAESGKSFTMPPHIRQPHRHGYWVGEGRKRYEVHFLDFVPVNMDKAGESPVKLED